MSLIVWISIWRLPTYSNDDLLYMSRGNLPYGQQTLSSMWAAFTHDFMIRNGRTSDATAMLFFASGDTMNRVGMALLCWGMTLALFLWIRAALPALLTSWMKAALTLAALLLPFALMHWDVRFAGSSIFFMSATVGYIGGLLLFFLATIPALKALRGEDVRPRTLYVGLFFGVWACYHHEALALCLFFFYAGAFMMRKNLVWSIPMARCAVATWAVAILRMGNPGLWARNSRNRPEPLELPEMISKIVRGIGLFSAGERIVLIASLLAIALAGLYWSTRHTSSEARKRTLTWTAIFVPGALVWVLLGETAGVALSKSRQPSSSTAIPTLVEAPLGLLLLVGVAAAAVGGVGLLMSLVVSQDRAWFLSTLAFMTAMGASVFPFLDGQSGGRAHFFTVFFLTVTMIVTSALLLRQLALHEELPWATVASALLLAAVPVSGLLGWSQTQYRLEKNHQAWLAVEKQFEPARQGTLKTVTFPKRLPYPEYAGDWPTQKNPPETFRIVFDLPKDAKLVWK